MLLKFTKMHGLGNDFMLVDAVTQLVKLPTEKIKQWSDRHFGIGFDQLLLVEPATHPTADFRYRIFNADGGEVQQCGNGARCFAIFVREKGLTSKSEIQVETLGGLLLLTVWDDNEVTVNMGKPRFEPAEIPLLAKQVSASYALTIGNESIDIGAVSMGNPHAIIRTNNIDTAPVVDLGSIIESHADFPEKANVGFMQVVNRSQIRLRVYERGAKETLACGTGACAAVVTGIHQGLLEHEVHVQLPGGELFIQWPGVDQDVLMSGPATTVFEGTVIL